MSDAALILQRAAVAAIGAHPALSLSLAGIYDGPPPRAPFPYLTVGQGLVSDWGTKTKSGREVRLAFTLWDDRSEATPMHAMIGQLQEALDAIPRDLEGWRIASSVFVRSLIARDAAGPWSGLVEQRMRMLAV